MSDSWLGLNGKVCVVTGAVGGMGTVFCKEYAKQGATVVMVDLLEDKVNAYAKEIHEEYNVPTLAIKCDTTDEDEVDAAVKKVVDTFGKVDVVLNTAAILRFSPLEDLRLDEWKTSLNVNVTGYFLMSQRFGRVMIEQKHGTLLHISTIASRFPETYSAGYSTTKAAVNMLSRQIAAEWGQYGVRSNCILPCFVKTPLSAGFYSDPEVEKGRKRLTASRRIGTIDDIANAVMYLSSDRSDYTNGGELTVEGGFGIMMGDMTPKPGGRRGYAVEHHQPAKK